MEPVVLTSLSKVFVHAGGNHFHQDPRCAALRRVQEDARAKHSRVHIIERYVEDGFTRLTACPVCFPSGARVMPPDPGVTYGWVWECTRCGDELRVSKEAPDYLDEPQLCKNCQTEPKEREVTDWTD